MARQTSTKIAIETQEGRLRRLSIVFAVEVRLKIVAELCMREMSPKQFYEEFGGGTLSKVARNFKRLAEYDWLELTRSEGPGGSRRGGVEHFYRAKEPAFFDPETWATLPHPIRVAYSWNSFKEIAARLRAALEAEQTRPAVEREITSIALSMDEQGWRRVIDAVRAQFDFLFEEQRDAARRLASSRETPIRASVVQMAFESTSDATGQPRLQLAENPKEPATPFTMRLSKLFADPLYLKIIEVAAHRPISATEFQAEFGGDTPEGIRRRFRKLARMGWLRQVDGKTGGRRRGAVEKYYCAAGPAIYADRRGPWAKLSESVQAASDWQAFEALSTEVKASMKDGTFDYRDDSCLAWSLLRLDGQGWGRIHSKLDELLALALEEQERAAARLEKAGETPIAMTVALAAFESPKEAEAQL